METKKRFVKIAVAGMMVLGLVSMSGAAAFAEEVVGQVNIAAGDLDITPAGVTITGFALDGLDHLNVAKSSEVTPWPVQDLTGSGLGWTVTVAASDFITETGAIHPILASGLKMNVGTIELAAAGVGNTVPTAATGFSGTDFAALSNAGVVIMTAAKGNGMGKYTFTPDFTLDVPAETYAGDYTSDIVVTIAPLV